MVSSLYHIMPENFGFLNVTSVIVSHTPPSTSFSCEGRGEREKTYFFC